MDLAGTKEFPVFGLKLDYPFPTEERGGDYLEDLRSLQCEPYSSKK